MRVNITMPENLLDEVDRFAKDHGFTRSGLLAQAARQHIRKATIFE
jgi:metal-responsive CopG/Arc/MetJ family transcriptional regulator